MCCSPTPSSRSQTEVSDSARAPPPSVRHLLRQVGGDEPLLRRHSMNSGSVAIPLAAPASSSTRANRCPRLMDLQWALLRLDPPLSARSLSQYIGARDEDESSRIDTRPGAPPRGFAAGIRTIPLGVETARKIPANRWRERYAGSIPAASKDKKPCKTGLFVVVAGAGICPVSRESGPATHPSPRRPRMTQHEGETAA